MEHLVVLKSLKVGDYSLKIHKSAYHLFSLFISKRSFSSLQTRKSFGEILRGNHRFLRPSIRLLLNDNAMFYESFICFCISEAKPLCFSLCSQMFDDVEGC